jgi:chitin disaccharide deacetylase
MTNQRYLIVNADDFGRSSGVNRGIVEARERGIVTSASLMVRWPAAVEAAAYARAHPDFSLGLHVDLGEWIYRGDIWMPAYEVVPTDDEVALVTEIANQLATFKRLVGRSPSHIDSHQHVHRHEPVQSILLETARGLAVPLRHSSPSVVYCGGFYGQDKTGAPYPQGISIENLLEVLAELSPGFTELGCHPGVGNDLPSIYCSERAQEVQVLCDPQVRALLIREAIELCSFHDIQQLVLSGVRFEAGGGSESLVS